GADVVKRDEATGLLSATGAEHAAAFLCVEERDRGFKGQSWQLAAALAGRCLRESDSLRTVKLASEWVVTGRVERDRVTEVWIGNKAALKTILRNWIFPMANHPDVVAFIPA